MKHRWAKSPPFGVMTSGLFHHFAHFIGKDAFHRVPFLIPLNHVLIHRKSPGSRITHQSLIPVWAMRVRLGPLSSRYECLMRYGPSRCDAPARQRSEGGTGDFSASALPCRLSISHASRFTRTLRPFASLRLCVSLRFSHVFWSDSGFWPTCSECSFQIYATLASWRL